MISNTHYKSGLVAFKNNRPITEEWLVNYLKLTDKTVKNSIKTLVDRGIINKSTTNYKTKYFLTHLFNIEAGGLTELYTSCSKTLSGLKENKQKLNSFPQRARLSPFPLGFSVFKKGRKQVKL